MANSALVSRLRSLRTAFSADIEGVTSVSEEGNRSPFSQLLGAAVAIQRAHHAMHGRYMSADAFRKSFLTLVTSDEAIRQFLAETTLSPKEAFAIARISRTPDLLPLAFPEIVMHADELSEMPVTIFVEMLYRILLGRRGEMAEVAGWECEIASGRIDHASVLAAFENSDEAQLTGTGLSILIIPQGPAANMAYFKAARRFQTAELDRLHDLAVLIAMATE